MAKGRPRSNRQRRKDGRLVPLIDKGNDFVQRRREAFAVFQGGKAGDQLGDPIGRAWAVGLLDGQPHDAAILRDMGRRYADLHAIVYRRTQVRVGEMEPRSRGTAQNDNDDRDPMGERFAVLDKLARDAGSKERLAMQKLCLVENPDENPPWLDRLVRDASFAIYARSTQSRGLVTVFLPAASDRDRMILTQAVNALVAMVEG